MQTKELTDCQMWRVNKASTWEFDKSLAFGTIIKLLWQIKERESKINATKDDEVMSDWECLDEIYEIADEMMSANM
jgi:hypothetical protein